VDELKELLTPKKVKVWDKYKKEHFYLRALLFVTITDLPGLGCLSGQVTKGYKGCVVCIKETDGKWMKNSNKMVYVGHRWLLRRDHPYRNNRKSFYGQTDDRVPPQTVTRKDILKKVNSLQVILGKGKGSKQASNNSLFKKKYIFFELPCWEHLHVRHTLDGMHITKNMTESLLRTLTDSKGEGKDSLKTHLDLQELKARLELHPVLQPDGTQKIPVAALKGRDGGLEGG
jgi:hypothetical protein